MLTVRNLSVTLSGDEIIKDLSFSVKQGEVVTILGPNGAGKTVLLRALMGLVPHSGSLTWQGTPEIGYLPQGLNQFAVKDYPLTVKDIFSLKSPKSKLGELHHFLGLVGLDEDILGRKAGNLSGGQFQRMLIAWVLISHPQVLFFDEPATGIDIGGGETIYSLMQTICEQEKTTVLLVTHDLNVVYRLSAKVLCLSRQDAVCFGKPEDILNPATLQHLFGPNIGTYEHHPKFGFRHEASVKATEIFERDSLKAAV